MNAHDEDPVDQVDDAYRQASVHQAGTPSAATRRAIRDAAHAEANSRRPAANDARYLWRAAAGIAVLGIALLLWRQTDPRLPASPAARAPAASSAEAVAPADTTAAVAARETAGESERRQERAAANASPDADIAALLHQAFPETFASAERGAAVWILRDASGAVVRSGTFAGTDDLASVQAAMQREFPDRQLSGWSRQTGTNARGAVFEVHIAELR